MYRCFIPLAGEFGPKQSTSGTEANRHVSTLMFIMVIRCPQVQLDHVFINFKNFNGIRTLDQDLRYHWCSAPTNRVMNPNLLGAGQLFWVQPCYLS